VTQGEEGLLAMTAPQAVSARAGRFRPHYDLAVPNGNSDNDGMLRALLESSHAADFADRCRGWWRLLRAAWPKAKG
jgi:hypothetical protein